jgi:hypothetical protein
MDSMVSVIWNFSLLSTETSPTVTTTQSLVVGWDSAVINLLRPNFGYM